MLIRKGTMSTKTMVLGAILTALVIVLQFMGAFVHLGPFSISLVLVPIVIGSATCGTGIGAWLGLVFGIVVLASGDAALFLAVSIPGTIITVIAKGVACGFFSAMAYKCFAGINRYVAVGVSAIVCPIVNTGVFLIGCKLFFMEKIMEWAGGSNVGHYMIFGLVGANFLLELGINIVLSPVIVRLINLRIKN